MANTKVQSEQIEDGSITADKIADGAIVATEIADNAVTTAKINADAVTGAKIADDAIDSEHYTDGSIDTAHIADAQITVAKMAANSVDSDQYVDGSIDTVHIGDAQVTTAKITDGNISTAKIADNAVTSAKIDTNIDIAGTFDVTGATTLDSTLAVAGISTFSESIQTSTSDHNLSIGMAEFNSSNYSTFNLRGTTGGQMLLGRNSGANDWDYFTFTTNGLTRMGTASGDDLAIHTNSSGTSNERIRILSDGRVGIGTDSPEYELEVKASTDASINIRAGTNSGDFAGLYFGDTDYPAEGRITYQNSDDAMRFWANRSQAMMIDSSGRVIIGNTTSSAHANTDDLQVGNTTGNHGIQINAANTGNSSIFFGDNDSTLVGQLEYVHASDYLAIVTGGNQRIRIDAHGLKFGTDTAEANALDDYEEGTFTPTILGTTTNPTMSYAAQLGRYTKIGSMVTVYYYVGGSQSGGAGQIRVGGLPYTIENVTGNSVQHYASTYNVDTNSNSVFGTSWVGTTQVQFYQTASLGTWGALGYPSHVTGTFYFAGQFSYKT